jgi:hypothetical protein
VIVDMPATIPHNPAHSPLANNKIGERLPGSHRRGPEVLSRKRKLFPHPAQVSGMLQAADLSYADVAQHMNAYLRAGYRTSRGHWTVCIPAQNLKGQPWREVLMPLWHAARAKHCAFDLRLFVEDLADIPPDRVLVLIGIVRA